MSGRTRRWLASGLGSALVLATLQASAAATVDDLFGAAAIDNLRDVRRLVSVVDPRSLDPRGDTLLIAAIRNDADRVTQFLIADPKTDIEATNVSSETPLMLAAFRNKRVVVDQLLARDAEVNRPGWTALHYAASVDARDIVGVLLERSAYIDADSPNGTTPLMMAARGGFEALCRQLVEAGADPTPINQRDLTAADFARRAGRSELGQWLDGQADVWRAKYGASSSRRPTPAP